MASFGKHLHAKQNSKLAKYAESANFAYLSKNAQQVQKKRQGASTFQKVRIKKPSAQTHKKCKNAKGLRPFKRSEPKHLRHKRKTSAKTRQGFDLSKHPNQKGHIKCKAMANRMPRKNRKMDARKGEGMFFFHKNLRHPSFDLSKTKRTKTLEDNSAKERGETFFHQKQSFRALPRQQTNLISKQQTLQQKIPPGNDSLGRGETFFQEPP